MSKLGIDAVGVPYIAFEILTSLLLLVFSLNSPRSPTVLIAVPLHVATRSTRARALIIDSPSIPSGSLSSISLCLNFVSPPSLQNASQSQSTSQGGSQEGLLIHQLLAPYPAPLHFTLSPLLRSALSRLFGDLSETFPICFNPTWVDRLSNDLPSLRSVAGSLSRSLKHSTLLATGQLDLSELSEACDLQQDLIELFSPAPQTDPTATLEAQNSSLTSSEAIERSLLLLGKQAHLVDPVNLDPISERPAPSPATPSSGRRGSRRGRGVTRARGRGRGRGRLNSVNLRRSNRKRGTTGGGYKDASTSDNDDDYPESDSGGSGFEEDRLPEEARVGRNEAVSEEYEDWIDDLVPSSTLWMEKSQTTNEEEDAGELSCAEEGGKNEMILDF
ncbi:uncharacterized protein JCM6883_002532 [Sporobolomyces salmoneus]|uniref:uncharacterized protein n=1 Tax=Sporobolomyces salmoneus TaxID=183962 RepID=UPI00316E8F40